MAVAPSRLGRADEVLAKAARENFPVALFALPAATRQRLRDVYGFARLVDDAGDLAEGDREELLDWIEADLDRGEHPLIARARDLPRGPLLRLVEANRQDQRVSRYGTFEELVAYCDLSANPVGELVLHVFGAATPERVAWSDSICTGLQLAEHWQDVGEDRRADRIYLPLEDLERFGVSEELEPAGAFRELMAFEVARARRPPHRAAPPLDPSPPSAARRGRFRRRRLRCARRRGALRLRRARPLPARGQGPAAGVDAAGAVNSGAARRSSFYYGMRLLPRERREAMFAVYETARRIDDIADGDLPADEKLRLLAEERARATSPALHDLIDGAEMDVRGATYETFDDLLVYARRVGGSIGRLSLEVFGSRNPAAAEPLADDLGVALQLTNVLRDVREDLGRGRVYIPREDLDRFGVELEPPVGPVAELVCFEAARAHEWFARGLGVVDYLDRPSAKSVAAMAGIYRRLLARIEREPESVLERRVSLPVWEKGWVAARSLIGAAA